MKKTYYLFQLRDAQLSALQMACPSILAFNSQHTSIVPSTLLLRYIDLSGCRLPNSFARDIPGLKLDSVVGLVNRVQEAC